MGHFAHRAEMLFQWNAQAQQQLTGAGFGGVAVHLGELGFQLGHGHAVFFGHFRQRVDAVALGLDLPQLFVAHDHGVDHGEFFVGELVLAQFTQAHVRLQHDLAAGRLEIAAEDFHEGRLAATVGTDQTIAVAALNLTETFSKSGLAPNCMVMLAVEINYFTYQYLESAYLSWANLVPIWSFSSSLRLSLS
jgi:hypothetical protein